MDEDYLEYLYVTGQLDEEEDSEEEEQLKTLFFYRILSLFLCYNL